MFVLSRILKEISAEIFWVIDRKVEDLLDVEEEKMRK